jgi:uncharacterized glyoxalase superfamily protein PhnB
MKLPSRRTVGWSLSKEGIPKDLDGTFERLQASGAEVVQGPTEQPYGIRDGRDEEVRS